MARKSASKTIPVNAVKHRDKRANIPTRELRDFVADEEKSPKSILYPRDPSLDPQLVWKGKEKQDSADLSVPAVPIYIQEKIQPQAIIENVRAQALKDSSAEQMGLFADFNGIAFEELVDFYRHEQNWSNRMILGDSLLVMTSLAEKEGLKGKVQMIYMDPPYGIKFGSNWQVSTRKRDVKDGKVEDATRQPEQIKAFRDTWQLGIHSYLAYIRDRLTAARELLTESGSVFVQIGDENVHLVRCVMDEVFGSENYISLINYTKTSGQTAKYLAVTTDYILWYAKNWDNVKYRNIFREKLLGREGSEMYQNIELEDGTRRRLSQEEIIGISSLPNSARPYRLGDITSQRQGRPAGPGSAMHFPVVIEGKEFVPPGSRGWSTTREGMNRIGKAQRLVPQGDRLSYMRYLYDFSAFEIDNNWIDCAGTIDRIYVVQTNLNVIARCIFLTTDPGDLVLDPTCGSGTTAYVAEQWGRRWITVDTSRVAIALARTRLMAARYPYYLLADTPEGAKKEREVTGNSASAGGPMAGDIKKGFIYRRVPHVTLKSIANNEEIDVIHARWEEKLEPIRSKLNSILRQSWEEWQVPREPAEKWPSKAVSLHEEWWKMRRDRQKEIDASIARHGDTELLYDQPFEDNKRVRVTGPLTVESLSPHRVLAPEEERPVSEKEAKREMGVGQFETMIIENLRASGVQNTIKGERLKFDRLESFAGAWIQAAGEYTEAGKCRRIAVCIGPEHGTVGPDLVKEAAKEAVQGTGFDLLIICGFAFDPHVSEEAKRYGKLTVLAARMNPDLAMGEALLKKTGAGNLFMVFGEPDVEIKKRKDGKIEVAIRGVDVYDPTTGEIRSHSTDDIACWFIDTDYNGESFFVRHAYFTGADEPYEKLKRALRADINEAAWSALYSAKSYPFDPPRTGKIAVKVINHYGDEVMKVYHFDETKRWDILSDEALKKFESNL